MALSDHKELVQAALAGTSVHAPAAFFLHFDSSAHEGAEAIRKHAELFHATGMDLSKVQLELKFPQVEITKPSDWAKLPRLDEAFFASQLDVVEGVVRELGDEANVIVTLYSAFMCASMMGGEPELNRDIQIDAAPIEDALGQLARSLEWFVGACADRGVSGMYLSTQGAEVRRLKDRQVFLDSVKPYDLVPMRAAVSKLPLNVLHVCDFHEAKYGGYEEFTPFLDYPGQVVSCNPEHLGPKGISELFGRPFMGGLDRLGVLTSGPIEAIQAATHTALSSMPDKFIFAANCTVPSDTPWENLRAAVDVAHAWTRG